MKATFPWLRHIAKLGLLLIMGIGPQAKRINIAMQKHSLISDYEQERMNMEFERKNKAKLTPLTLMTISLLMIPGCVIDTSHVGQYIKPYESWKEEVALQDGRMLIVDRALSYGRSAGIGQGRLIDKRTLDFVIPGTRQKVHWEGDEHVIPMLLGFKDGVPYLAAIPFSCFSFELLGRPIPPYVLYKYTGQWERIAMADFPLEFVQANLSTGDKDYIERFAGEKIPNETGYVPARIVMKANTSKDVSYRSIVRSGKGNFGGCLEELEQLDKNRRK